jgi:hypothetical protein
MGFVRRSPLRYGTQTLWASGYFTNQSQASALARADSGKLHALGRIGRPDEVARLALCALTPADQNTLP